MGAAKPVLASAAAAAATGRKKRKRASAASAQNAVLVVVAVLVAATSGAAAAPGSPTLGVDRFAGLMNGLKDFNMGRQQRFLPPAEREKKVRQDVALLERELEELFDMIRWAIRIDGVGSRTKNEKRERESRRSGVIREEVEIRRAESPESAASFSISDLLADQEFARKYYSAPSPADWYAYGAVPSASPPTSTLRLSKRGWTRSPAKQRRGQKWGARMRKRAETTTR